MNNYCTNCGNKLDKKQLECSKCNTPIVDIEEYLTEIKDKEKNKEKIKKIILIITIFLTCIILLIILIKRIQLEKYKNSIVEKNISTYNENNNYKVKSLNRSYCRKCDGGCDGSCVTYKTDYNCYIYKYKVITDAENEENYKIYLVKENNEITIYDNFELNKIFSKFNEIITKYIPSENINKINDYTYDMHSNRIHQLKENDLSIDISLNVSLNMILKEDIINEIMELSKKHPKYQFEIKLKQHKLIFEDGIGKLHDEINDTIKEIRILDTDKYD